MAPNTTIKTIKAQAPQGVSNKTQASIMVVDDDPLILDFLQEYLNQCNYKVHAAGSGEDAIARMTQSPPDIVLVDLKMPGLDGLQTIEKISEIDPDIVTILMTGFPTLDSSVKAIRLGASDYILKPFKLDEVDLALKNAIHEHEVRQEMKNLRNRVYELEHKVSEKREQITINRKLDHLVTQNTKS